MGGIFSEGGSVLTPVLFDATKNWQSGTATSLLAGADLLTIGVDGTPHKIMSMFIDTTNIAAGANITIRAYMKVNGVTVDIYNSLANGQTFVKGLDTTGIWLFNGETSFPNAVRIEVATDQAADNGKQIKGEYLTE